MQLTQNQQLSASLIIYASSGVVGLCLVAAVLYRIYIVKRRRKRTQTAIKTAAVEGDTSMQTEQTSSITSIYSTKGMGMTTIVGGNEVALPGYMLAADGIDFTTDTTRPAIAEGGGGVIRYCKF